MVASLWFLGVIGILFSRSVWYYQLCMARKSGLKIKTDLA